VTGPLNLVEIVLTTGAQLPTAPNRRAAKSRRQSYERDAFRQGRKAALLRRLFGRVSEHLLSQRLRGRNDILADPRLLALGQLMDGRRCSAGFPCDAVAAGQLQQDRRQGLGLQSCELRELQQQGVLGAELAILHFKPGQHRVRLLDLVHLESRE
jgi:hypothetical protein